MSKVKSVFCWSGGKDSSLALYEIQKQGEYDVKYLLTTLSEEFSRISMHGVREELLEAQAASIGIPLKKVYVAVGSNAEYEQKMETMLLELKSEGIEHVIFGDIFLEDLREYRENNLAKVGMKAVFPLWKRDTKELIQQLLELGFRTITCCVNDAFLGEREVGVEIDDEFISSLPENVDPCGENGEFHTFCFEGPIFKSPIKFSIEEKVYRPLPEGTLPAGETKGFWYCDLEKVSNW